MDGGGEWKARERKDVLNFDESAQIERNSGECGLTLKIMSKVSIFETKASLSKVEKQCTFAK